MTTPTSRRNRWLVPVAGLGAMALLAGCARNAPQDTWQPAGSNARKINNLQHWPFAIAGVVLVIVASVVVYSIFKFRDRGQAMPAQTHGKPALEIALTVLPALILIGIGIPTIRTVFQLAKTSDTQCIINVTGQQWWWEYDYPVQSGCGAGIKEPIVTSGEFVIPAGENVLLRITSRDVIHSFWIPKLNGKRDAVPGRIQTLRIEADHPGIYDGQCTEFCGLSHAYMRMDAVSLDAASFNTWTANQLKAYTAPTDAAGKAGESAFLANCSSCHQVNGILSSDGTPVIARPDLRVWSGAAPNLTNLMTRTTFAGGSFDLLTPSCRDNLRNASPSDFSAKYLQGTSPQCLDAVQLREWLRNAPAKKPMYTTGNLSTTNGKTRGMPNLGLSENTIDSIIAYLTERK